MFSLRIALRYLFSKKSHNAVNIISFVSMAGVAVATAAIVCVLSVFNGFEDLARTRMSVNDPQLKIVPVQGKVMAGADSLALKVSKLKDVAAALPTLEENALAMHLGSQIAVTMRGVPAGYEKVVRIDSTVVDGDYLTSNISVPVATVSVGVALRLDARPSDRTLLSLYVPKRVGRINTANPMSSFRSDSLFVAGVYRIADNERDAETILVPIDMVRGLLQYENGEATAVEVALAPGASESDAAKRIAELLGPDYRIMNRTQQEAQSFKMIAIEKWITFLMLTFILVIASFNVVSTLSMLILEKKNNLWTLRAIGASTATIRRIFMWEGALISIVGGIAGIVTGIGLCLAQQAGGFIKLNGDPAELAITVYPVRVEATDMLVVSLLIALVGLSIGFVTSRFIPATSSNSDI